MYETKTQDSIHQELLTNIDDQVDKREGSVAYDLTAPASFMLEALYVELDAAMDLSFADTSGGYFLERRTKERGISRKAASKATGSVTLSHSGIITVPAGERLAASTTAGTVYFVTTADAALSANSVTVEAEAETGGANGNVAAGQITAFAAGSNFANVVTVTNAAAFEGGADIESDEDLRARYLTAVQRPATSGNANQYEQWALEISGIRKARVYPVWNGPGTVKVVIVETDGTAPPASTVEEVQAHIETLKPIGADVTVSPATERVINITATVALEEGATIETVAQSYREGIAALFTRSAFESSTVRYTELSSLLFEQPGLLDFSNLTLNGASSNVLLTADEVAVLGTVTFNVA